MRSFAIVSVSLAAVAVFETGCSHRECACPPIPAPGPAFGTHPQTLAFTARYFGCSDPCNHASLAAKGSAFGDRQLRAGDDSHP